MGALAARGASAGAGPQARALLLCALLALALLPCVDGYGKGGKKSKFLEAYPMLFKFFLFWWCVVVFVLMGFYILDQLMFKKFGSARVNFSFEHRFKSGSTDGREAFWEQLADPTKWSPEHPVLQSADIRMVRCTKEAPGDKDKAATNGESATQASDAAPVSNGAAPARATQLDADGLPQPAPSARLEDVPLQPLAEGLGFVLRHKASRGGPAAGSFFCTRECVKLERPAEGTWRLVMRTVEVGTGYPYDEDTEETDVEMHPPAEDGSVRCVIAGAAKVKSRIFRWWNSLEANGRLGAASMMQAIEDEVLASKKKD